MRSDALTILLIIMGIILGIVVYLVLFVPPQEVMKYFGKSGSNQPANFKVSLMYYSSNSIGAFIYNQGPGNLYLDQMNIYAVYYPYGGNYNCSVESSNSTISPGNQELILLNCENEKQIIQNLLSNNGYYVFYFNYGNYQQTYNLTSSISSK